MSLFPTSSYLYIRRIFLLSVIACFINLFSPLHVRSQARFIYFVVTGLAAKSICMEKVTELPRDGALKHFEKVLLENDPQAKEYYLKNIKNDKEKYDDFLETVFRQVRDVQYTDEQLNDRKLFAKAYKEDNCEKILNDYQ